MTNEEAVQESAGVPSSPARDALDDKVRVVVLDPATDAVLDQTDELPVKLGI